MIEIAVDMMGSDLGPETLSEAVKNYAADHKDVAFRCFGDEKRLHPLLSGASAVQIVDTQSIIPMEIKPLDFLRKKDSSMYKAIEAVRDKTCTAVVSAGSTGGFISGATILLRNIPGVTRAGLCAAFPTFKKGKAAVILDVGANNVNTAEDLLCFAKMGRLYAREVLGVEEPKVYTLSNGLEEGKGTDEIVKAYSLFKEQDFPGFAGNAEAREVLDGDHDVVVTPGFAGNILLKACEGTASLMNKLIKKAFMKSPITKVGYLFASSGFKDMKESMDYKKDGGAILLGVNGVAVKAHGNSDSYAFYNAIDVARRMAESHIVEKIGGMESHD